MTRPAAANSPARATLLELHRASGDAHLGQTLARLARLAADLHAADAASRHATPPAPAPTHPERDAPATTEARR